VDLLTPRGHTGAKPVRVTWTASDADGDPLTFAVDYSADDGATWTPLTKVLDGGHSALLPGRLFGRSQRARVRVRANDGLREGIAVSGRLRAAGAPPLVTISDPRPGGALVNDHVEALSGYAVDDAGHVVPDRRLHWFAGHRRLGRGGSLSVLGLPAGGRVRLRLVATDRRGRRGSASIVVEVTGHPPRFIELTGRRAGARSLRLRVASSIPARLRVSGAHVRRHRSRVGPAARTVRVRLRGRAGRRVRVRLRLSSGRLASKLELTVRRRAG
jgi:hypothetical protein